MLGHFIRDNDLPPSKQYDMTTTWLDIHYSKFQK